MQSQCGTHTLNNHDNARDCCYSGGKPISKSILNVPRSGNLVGDHRGDTSKLRVVCIYDESNHRESHNSSFFDRTRFREIELGSAESKEQLRSAKQNRRAMFWFRIGQRGKDIECNCEFFDDGGSNINRVGTQETRRTPWKRQQVQFLRPIEAPISRWKLLRLNQLRGSELFKGQKSAAECLLTRESDWRIDSEFCRLTRASRTCNNR